MSTKKATAPPMLEGRATDEGTARFAARFASRFAPDFYRPLGTTGLHVSSIGLGTYLGECDAADDERYTESAHLALASGINLLDSAVNYRCQRSERALGRAASRAVRGETVARDEVIVCTKGGYIPLDGAAPETREEYREYVTREYLVPGIARAEDIVAGGHCLAPSYLANQLERSRANLGLATIDIYYVHNPEQQLDAVSPEELDARLRQAFVLLEERCAAGEIGVYGCATWNGFRVPPDARGHLSLERLVALARQAGGEAHRFKVVQLPVNLALAEAVRTPTQMLGGQPVTLLQAAAELGVAVIASASLMQSQLATGLPPGVREALPGLQTDAQRAIAFVRSLPVVAAGLVGMKSREHLKENLAAGKQR